jgi:hypothetical protein
MGHKKKLPLICFLANCAFDRTFVSMGSCCTHEEGEGISSSNLRPRQTVSSPRERDFMVRRRARLPAAVVDSVGQAQPAAEVAAAQPILDDRVLATRVMSAMFTVLSQGEARHDEVDSTDHRAALLAMLLATMHDGLHVAERPEATALGVDASDHIGDYSVVMLLTSSNMCAFSTDPNDKSGTVDLDGHHCVVCLSSWCEGDQLRILPCLHRFHAQCLDPWLRAQQTCPLCRRLPRDVAIENAQREARLLSDGNASLESDVPRGEAVDAAAVVLNLD